MVLVPVLDHLLHHARSGREKAHATIPFVPTVSFLEGRRIVLHQLAGLPQPPREQIGLPSAFARILAEDAAADRDYPPVARSIRDGFALRSQDLPGTFQVVGEIRAGESSTLSVGPKQAIEIMTGAPVPSGADTVVMVEHVSRQGLAITTDRRNQPGEFINPAAAEAAQGAILLTKGQVLTYPRIALLATIGKSEIEVYAKPSISILSTGDEVVDIHQPVQPWQVRNSNAWSLAAQVTRAGGNPVLLPIARDDYAHTRELIERGFQSDLLLLSGGVSAGKYDLVEKVLSDIGAEFFFDRVKIQPGQPLVFGKAAGKYFFGLPGNPASTMVTFEVFARAAVERLAGLATPSLPLAWATLTEPFRHKPGLTRFLPARLSPDGYEITPIRWQGSSDVPSLARANAYLVADESRESWDAGDRIGILLQ
ncbi:MAG: molybdopterin molybdotransferase MoeA [Bryobacterales bacterium]|nr:molybdopterin molybdotransferase MoeA [Bryobacterales bacterium]